MLLSLGGVAEAAVDLRNVCSGMWEGDVLVAEGAPDTGGAVDRGRQSLWGYQEPVAALHSLEHGRVPVTHQAHVVPLGLQRPGGDGKSQKKQGCPPKGGSRFPHQTMKPPRLRSDQSRWVR